MRRIRFRLVLPIVFGFLSLILFAWEYENDRVIESMGMAWDMGPPMWPYRGTVILLCAQCSCLHRLLANYEDNWFAIELGRVCRMVPRNRSALVVGRDPHRLRSAWSSKMFASQASWCVAARGSIYSSRVVCKAWRGRVSLVQALLVRSSSYLRDFVSQDYWADTVVFVVCSRFNSVCIASVAWSIAVLSTPSTLMKVVIGPVDYPTA
jgi:hypothetical protein